MEGAWCFQFLSGKRSGCPCTLRDPGCDTFSRTGAPGNRRLFSVEERQREKGARPTMGSVMNRSERGWILMILWTCLSTCADSVVRLLKFRYKCLKDAWEKAFPRWGTFLWDSRTDWANISFSTRSSSCNVIFIFSPGTRCAF